MSKQYRALHYVLKIGDRRSAIEFFKGLLGMKVLRHEEFEKGCEATCNGPYDGRWSKTMIGYGPEDTNFVLELTYNYGIGSYRHGNALESIEIQKQDISALQQFPGSVIKDGWLEMENNGYMFKIYQGISDKIKKVNLRVGRDESVNLMHIKFYENLLGMKELNSKDSTENIFTYGEEQAVLGFKVLDTPKVDHGTAFGRTAFSCPTSDLAEIQKSVEEAKFEGNVGPKILTPLISLDTPGKATVSVVIVADLSGHEICFVGDEGFRELSKVDPAADDELLKQLEDDKSSEWFAKHGKKKEEA